LGNDGKIYRNVHSAGRKGFAATKTAIFAGSVELIADSSKSMDLVNAIVQSQQQQLDSQVQFAAARKVLEAQKQAGSAAIQLLDAASESGEQSVDTLAVAATGLGGSVDTYA